MGSFLDRWSQSCQFSSCLSSQHTEGLSRIWKACFKSPRNSPGLLLSGYLASALGAPCCSPHVLVLPCFCYLHKSAPTPLAGSSSTAHWLLLRPLGQAGIKEKEKASWGRGAGKRGSPGLILSEPQVLPFPQNSLSAPRQGQNPDQNGSKTPLKLQWPKERPLGLHLEESH